MINQHKHFRFPAKRYYSWLIGLFFLFAGLPFGQMATAQNVSATWGANANTAWYTAGNWAGGSYAGVQGAATANANIATFTSAFTGTTPGINMGTASLNLGAISIDNTRTTALNLGNSSATGGVLRLYGASITAANQVVRNNGTGLFTLQAAQNGAMGVVLSNATDNIFQIDAAGGITVTSIISELAAGYKLTKSGTGAGVLELQGQNTYTGLTTVTGGTLRLNRTGGTTIPTGNSVVVNSGGTLRISTAQTLANVTVDVGGTLIVDATLTITGTATINGTFQLNTGGWATGGAWTYGASGTLNFNASSAYTVNNGDVFWPTTNGPVNVNVLTGGMTLNSASRTVSGTFATASGITQTSSTLTLNGICQMNSGAFFNQAPTYGPSSTLIYTSNYGLSNEWTGGGNTNPTAGVGVPANITIQGGTVTLPNTSRGLPGTLTVNSGATLTFNGTSGDLYLGGNFTMNGTLNHSGRNFFFVRGNAQTINSTNASVAFNALTINKTGGTTLTLAKPVTVNNALTFTAGFIDIGSFNLTIGSAASASSTSYVKTTSTGQLRQVVAGTARIFPVGTSAYNPITLTNSGTSDTYGIIEIDGTVPDANDATRTIDRRWQVTENVAGGGNLAVVAQYNSGEEGTNYNAAVTPYLGLYTTSAWNQVSATLAGSNPFTATSGANFTNSISGTSYFAIGKDLGLSTPPPTVSSFLPISGYSGTTVVIQGSGFTGATAVTFGGGNAASFVVDNDNQITAVVGSTAASGSVGVTTGGTGALAGFTFSGFITTVGATDWNTTASWLGNAVPTANRPVTIAHNLNIAANVVGNMSSVIINNGITLTWTATATLNIAAAGTLTNNGTITAGTGTVNFVGAGTVTGTSATTFNNLTINTGALNLGTGSRVDGNLTINGGNIDAAGSMPIYGPSSTLLYTVYYGRFREWDAVGIGTIGVTPGYPNNVTFNNGGDIKNNSTLARAINGLMTIAGGTVLQQDINAVVTFGGGLTINPGATYNNGVTNQPLNIGGNVTVTGAWQFNNMQAATNVTGNLTVNTGGNINMGGTNGGLFVSGDITIATGTNFSLSGVIGGDLYVAGNLTNNGVNFTPNTRAVFFNGSSQTISGGFNNTSGNNGFDFIRINNGTTVTLASPITIRTNLTFNSGKLVLSNFDLTLNSAATITTPTSTNYVQTTGTGLLKQTVTTAKFFPVGNSAYDPITLTNTGTSDVYGIRVGDAAPAAANVAAKAINRTWFVTENTLGGSNLSVVVAQYNSGEEGVSFNAGLQSLMGFYNASLWTIVPTTLAGAGPFTATSSGAAQFPATIPAGSYFGVGKDNAFGSAPSDYYRSVNTGPWATGATWESSRDNAIWYPATTGPGTGSTVTVQSPHIVTFSGSSVNPVAITIDNGATLTLSNSGNVGASASTVVNVNGSLVAPATIVSAANGMAAQTMTISSTGSFTNSVGTADAILVTNFIVQNGGTYTHDAIGSTGAGVNADFPGTSRNFGASSNVIVKKWANGLTPTSSNLPNGMGNLTLDIASLAGSWNQAAAINSIQGNLTVKATGGGALEFRFTGNGALTLTIGGTIDIQGGTPVITSGTATPTVNVGGGFTQSGGSFKMGATNSNLIFTSAGLGGNIDISGGSQEFTNIQVQTGRTIDILNSTNIVIPSPRTFTVNGTCNIGKDALISGSGTFTVANAATATLGIGSTNGIATVTTGAFGNVQTSTRNFNAGANYTYNSSVNQITGTGLTGAATVTIATTAGANVTLTKPVLNFVSITTAVNLTSGVLILDQADLQMGSNAIFTNGGSFSPSNMVSTISSNRYIGRIIKVFPTGTQSGLSFFYPLGDLTGTSEYSPVQISNLGYTNSLSIPYIALKVKNAKDPFDPSLGNYLNRYWESVSNFYSASAISCDAVFNYLPADVVGPGPESGLRMYRYTYATGLWTNDGISGVGNAYTRTGITGSEILDHDITGRKDLPDPIYFRSVNTGSGLFEDPNSWQVSTDPAFISPAPTTATAFPTYSNSDGIQIRAGHPIAIAVSAGVDQMVIDNGAVLSINSGAYMATLNGTGVDVTVNGTLNNFSTNINSQVQSGAELKITATGIYNHAADGGFIPNPVLGGIVTWDGGSQCQITGVVATSPANLSQSFSDFVWNSTSQTADVNMGLTTLLGFTCQNFNLISTGATPRILTMPASGSPTVGISGNLSVTGGNLNVSNSILSVTGTSTIGSSGRISFTSATNSRTFAGDVTIDGNWDNTANAAISFGAGLNVNSGSTFTVSNGVQTFTGTGTIAGTFPTAVTVPNISLTAGANITNARTAGLTISNSMGAGTGTLIQGTNAILNYQPATSITPTLDATASGNTVNYNAASANVKGTSYQNLNLPSGGIYVLGGTTTIGTDVNLNSTSKIRTNANALIMNPGATLSGTGAASYVWGNLQKNVATGSPVRTFEVGDATNYTPLTLTFTGVSVAGDLTASSSTPISATPGGLLLNKTISANRYWTLSNVNTLSFTSYVGNFNFVAGDLIGGALNADLKGAIYDGAVWNYPAVSGLAGNSATVNNASVLGTVVFAVCIPPTTYTLSGTNSGSYCAGGSGSTLSLSGSQIGVDYQLQIGGVDVGLPVSGTGLVLNLGDFTTNGAYTVVGTNSQTGCFNSMTGTVNVLTNPLPILGSVSQLAIVCDGINATIRLTGLLLSSNLTIAYSINGVPQSSVAVLSNGTGEASFDRAVTYADNGLTLEVTGITNTSLAPNCVQTFVSGNSVVLSVHPRPTVSISANDFVCQGQDAPVQFFLTGTGPWILNYDMGDPNFLPLTAQPAVNTNVSPYNVNYSIATVDRQYVVTSLSDANCAANPIGLSSWTISVPVPCSITWNGSANDGNWNNPNNWTPNNAAPSNKTSVVIPGVASQPNINTNIPPAVCAGLTMVGTALPNIGAGFQLDVRGDLYSTGSPYFTGAGKVILTGTGAQTVTGTVRLNNVDFANTSGGGVVVAAGGTLKIEPNGVATFLANSKLTTNGMFILASNATGTAKIGPIPTSAIISGPVTQQRYVPFNPGATGGWYFIGSPTGGQNFTDWSDNFRVTGLSSGFGSQGGGIINSSEPERSTIFKYVEADHNLRIDTVQKIGWTIPANENIIPGNGYRTYINYYSNSTHLFDNTGTITRGTGVNNEFTFPTLTRNEYAGCIPATFPCSEVSWRGWNLLANPFPCDLDWDAAASWSKPANMSDAWYRWHSSAGGYGVYTTGIYAGTTPAPASPNLIPASQAFFVRVAALPTNVNLVVKESAKSTSASGQYLRTNVAENERIRIHLARPGITNYGYDAVIRFMDEATDEIDMSFDFPNLGGTNFSISVPVSGQGMSIASFAPVSPFKTIPLSVDYKGNLGQFQLSFSEMDVLLENKTVYLRDNLLGTIHLISAGSVYPYFVSDSDNLNSTRFELIFSIDEVTKVVSKNLGAGMNIYPNPSLANKGPRVSITGFKVSKASFSIVDALGRVVYSTTVELNANGAAEFQINEKLSPGIYSVTTGGGSKNITQKMIVN